MTWLSPKAEVRPSGIEGRGLFAATRVAEGQHLLLDRTHPACYGNHSCDPNLWHADAVTGGDWRLPHLQEAYADHWTPPLLDRIRSATPATVRHRPEISKLSVAV